jgi:exodeoxyribonuclease VIII
MNDVAPLLPSQLGEGLHHGVANDAYHARELGVVSRSALDFFEVSPLTYWSWVRGEVPDRETAALRRGSAFHCAMLEPERFETDYAVMPDFGDLRLKGPKARRDEWRKAHEGKIELPWRDGAMLEGMRRAMQAHPLVSKILWKGVAESVVRWDDRELGLPCKAKPDWLVDELGLAADLKSAEDASLSAFERDLEKLGYHQQAAHYVDGLAAIGRRPEHFLFISVEKTPPHLIGLYTIHADDELAGRDKNRALMARLQDCLFKNDWPGLPADIVEARRPRWARRGA